MFLEMAFCGNSLHHRFSFLFRGIQLGAGLFHLVGLCVLKSVDAAVEMKDAVRRGGYSQTNNDLGDDNL